jgi:hypothetical protein
MGRGDDKLPVDRIREIQLMNQQLREAALQIALSTKAQLEKTRLLREELRATRDRLAADMEPGTRSDLVRGRSRN